MNNTIFSRITIFIPQILNYQVMFNFVRKVVVLAIKFTF